MTKQDTANSGLNLKLKMSVTSKPQKKQRTKVHKKSIPSPTKATKDDAIVLTQICSVLHIKLHFTIAEINFKRFNIYYFNKLCGVMPSDSIVHEQMRLETKRLLDERANLEQQLSMYNASLVKLKQSNATDAHVVAMAAKYDADRLRTEATFTIMRAQNLLP